MSKEQNNSKPQAPELEQETTTAPEVGDENPEASDPLPQQESTTNPPGYTEADTAQPQDEPSPPEERIAELERQLEQSEARSRMSEEHLLAAQKSLAEAVSRYRAMLLQSTPEAPESMVVGETIEEVDRSFTQAKALVQQVRLEVEEKLNKERLPAGSPTRGPADFSTLTPLEKIRSALSG